MDEAFIGIVFTEWNIESFTLYLPLKMETLDRCGSFCGEIVLRKTILMSFHFDDIL